MKPSWQSLVLNIAKVLEIWRGRLGTPIIRSSRRVDDIVDDSVFLCLLRVHDEVAFHVFFDFSSFWPRVLGQQLISNLAHPQDFAGMNVDVGCLAGESAHGGLMDQDARIGQCQPFLACPADKK